MLKVRDWRSLALPRASLHLRTSSRNQVAPDFCFSFLLASASCRRSPSKQNRSTLSHAPGSSQLRKVRDSNPRNPEGFNRFRVCPVRPLRQLSAAKIQLFSLASAQTANFLCSVRQNVWRRSFCIRVRTHSVRPYILYSEF